MNGDSNTIIDAAAAWHAASVNDDMDWDAFTAWLEADPRHAAAYDQIALSADAVDTNRATLAEPLPMAANDEDRAPAARRRAPWLAWGGGAVAAMLAVVLVVPQLSEPAPTVYVTTATARTIALEDGSRIQLAPRSRLEVAGRDQQQIALAGGAWFDVRHNPDRQMSISAGGMTISDVGTRFDVQTDNGNVRIAVEDGTVSVAGPTLARAIALTQGRSLLVDRSTRSATVRAVTAGQAGAWRSGRLSYQGSALSLVATDLSRYAGVKIEVADGVAARQFSGTLVIGDGEAALRDLSRLMDLQLERSASGYRLDKPAR
jgi:transmembrane sensor